MLTWWCGVSVTNLWATRDPRVPTVSSSVQEALLRSGDLFNLVQSCKNMIQRLLISHQDSAPSPKMRRWHHSPHVDTQALSENTQASTPSKCSTYIGEQHCAQRSPSSPTVRTSSSWYCVGQHRKKQHSAAMLSESPFHTQQPSQQPTTKMISQQWQQQ